MNPDPTEPVDIASKQREESVVSGFGSWDRHPYRVASGEMVTAVIRELWLEPVESAVHFQPGQYVLLSDTDWRVPQRSFSVANAPRRDGSVSILVTLVDGGATSPWAHRLGVGDEVLLEGPFGAFVTEADRTSPVLLLGAGSGLAPCRSLAEALLTEEPTRRVTLFFSGRTEADAISRDRFEQWQREHDTFRYLLTCTREEHAPHQRRPDARIPALLADMVGELRGWEVFTAGPPGFVKACAAAAQALGADPTDIRTEEFFVDPTPWTDVAPSAVTHTAPSEERP